MKVNFEQDANENTKMNFSFGASGLISLEIPTIQRKKRVSCIKEDG